MTGRLPGSSPGHPRAARLSQAMLGVACRGEAWWLGERHTSRFESETPTLGGVWQAGAWPC